MADTSAIPRVLVPLAITDAMLTSCTVAEPAAGETAWVSGGTYAVGDRRIRTTTHSVYECSAAHTGITTVPESDPTRWFRVGPTARWAALDNACSTQTTASTSLSFVFHIGFFNSVALYNLLGSTVDITVKDAPGGTVVYTQTDSLDGPYIDEYAWCWGPPRQKQKLVVSDLIPYPDAELTITISAGTGTTVGVGMIAIGDLRPLIVDDWGGTEYGAEASPVDFSYIKTNEFGDTTIVKRRSATDMKITVVMPSENADYALASVQEVLAIPAAWIGTTAPGHDGLNVFGLGTATLTYEGFAQSRMTINVKGLV